jgi:hypothetical protein
MPSRVQIVSLPCEIVFTLMTGSLCRRSLGPYPSTLDQRVGVYIAVLHKEVFSLTSDPHFCPKSLNWWPQAYLVSALVSSPSNYSQQRAHSDLQTCMHTSASALLPGARHNHKAANYAQARSYGADLVWWQAHAARPTSTSGNGKLIDIHLKGHLLLRSQRLPLRFILLHPGRVSWNKLVGKNAKGLKKEGGPGCPVTLLP